MCSAAGIAFLFSLSLGAALGLGCDLWLSPASFVCWRCTRRSRGRGGGARPLTALGATLAFSGASVGLPFFFRAPFQTTPVDRQSVAPSNLVPSAFGGGGSGGSVPLHWARPAGLITLAAPGHLIHGDVAGVTSLTRSDAGGERGSRTSERREAGPGSGRRIHSITRLRELASEVLREVLAESSHVIISHPPTSLKSHFRVFFFYSAHSVILHNEAANQYPLHLFLK